jgi:hypothetical protein
VTESEARHEFFRSQFESQLEKALEEEKAKFSSFHARPVPKTVLERCVCSVYSCIHT